MRMKPLICARPYSCLSLNVPQSKALLQRSISWPPQLLHFLGLVTQIQLRLPADPQEQLPVASYNLESSFWIQLEHFPAVSGRKDLHRFPSSSPSWQTLSLSLSRMREALSGYACKCQT
eukprot:c34822_g1_i1 orf=410-766(+)